MQHTLSDHPPGGGFHIEAVEPQDRSCLVDGVQNLGAHVLAEAIVRRDRTVQSHRQRHGAHDAPPHEPQGKALDADDEAEIFRHQGLQGIGRLGAGRATGRFGAYTGDFDAHIAVAERQMQLAGHDVHLGLVEVEQGLLRRVEIGQIGNLEALGEALGQDVDLGQFFDDRGECAVVRRGVTAVEPLERLGERADLGQVLTLRLEIRVKLRDLQRAEIGSDRAQAHGARLARHIGQAVGAGRRSADGRDLGDAERQVFLRHDHFETGDRHIQVEEAAQPGRPNAGHALQPVVDEGGIFPGVVDERRLPGGRYLRDTVAAFARPGIGHGKGQVAQLDPAADVGQGQGQGQDLDADGLALRPGPDLGEAEGRARKGGKAALQRLGQVPAQGIGIERARRRNRRAPEAQSKNNGEDKTTHGTMPPFFGSPRV